MAQSNKTRPISQALANWLQKGSYLNYEACNIFYREEGKGECLLLVHGYPLLVLACSRRSSECRHECVRRLVISI